MSRHPRVLSWSRIMSAETQPRRRVLYFFATLITAIAILVLVQQRESPAAPAALAPPPKDEVADFMQSKLAAINAAMEAAANDDYQAVNRAGVELVLLSQQVAWKQSTNAAYLQDTADFVQAAEFMSRMAGSEDSQGVAYSYGAVAACCLNCHRHVRAPKIAAVDDRSGQQLAQAGLQR